MSVLQHFPMVSQETNVTGDNKPSENRLYDCVAASIDAACRYLLNQPENSVFNPDDFKDQAYGDAYIGGTAATKYIAFCKSLGVNLSSVQGSNSQLVTLAHDYLAQEKPVIFTEPDPYSSDPGMTHVCCFYADGPGYLVSMDPFPLPGATSGHPVHNTDAAWASILRFNEIWILEKENDVLPPITLSNPTVANYFSLVNGDQWLSKRTKTDSGGPIVIHGLILADYQTYGATALHGLEALGLPVSNEIPIEQIGTSYQHLAGLGIVVQYFEGGVRVYDPDHKVDDPPGSGKVYRAHLYDGGVGTDPALTDLQGVYGQIYAAYQQQKATIAAQLAQIAQLQQQQPPDQSGVLAAYQSAFATLSGLNTQAQAILANPLKS